MKRLAPDHEEDPASDAAAFVQADQPTNHEESTGAGKSIINMLEVVRRDFSDTSAKVETDKPDAAAEHEKTTQQNKVAKTTTKDAKYKAQEATSLRKESAQLTSEKDTSNTELSTPSEDQLFQATRRQELEEQYGAYRSSDQDEFGPSPIPMDAVAKNIVGLTLHRIQAILEEWDRILNGHTSDFSVIALSDAVRVLEADQDFIDAKLLLAGQPEAHQRLAGRVQALRARPGRRIPMEYIRLLPPIVVRSRSATAATAEDDSD